MNDSTVLVLNQTYEPLNICQMRRALVLIHRGKAEMLENGAGFIHTTSRQFPIPSVIKLACLIKRPRLKPKLSRREIFQRDHYACQYCGRESRQLTLDHVIPRHQNGQHTWENLVSACVPCNRRKAGRTPLQASMKLRHRPQPPNGHNYCCIPHHYREVKQEWQKYLPQN